MRGATVSYLPVVVTPAITGKTGTGRDRLTSAVPTAVSRDPGDTTPVGERRP